MLETLVIQRPPTALIILKDNRNKKQMISSRNYKVYKKMIITVENNMIIQITLLAARELEWSRKI